AVRDMPKVAHYLHVPLQHGCNDVLKKMKRGYTVEEYRDMVHRIREHIPRCAISSDFIVGFCGETEEAHQKTMDAVREFRFKNSFIFKYSERAGTKAADNYPDDIADEVKRVRNNEMLDLQNAISAEDNADFIGTAVEVLVEGPSKNAVKAEQNRPSNATTDQLVGRSRCDRIVVFDGNPRLTGTIAHVAIQDCTPTTLIGQIITREHLHEPSNQLPILN
ncbi:MAG: radical SAM protein, partial [Planctomycetaceae bacterium]|nr:radical SAM protein [Planctomycetaceae bacterium]